MLPIHTILYPTDLSERANRVFPLACSLARDCGARVLALYVMPPPFGPEELEARHRPDDYYHGPREALHRLQPPGGNVLVEHRLLEGDAVATIVGAAAEAGAGLICMGTHGRTGPGRLLLGSVAEGVLRTAPCPVLTAKVAPPSSGEEVRSDGVVLWPLKTILCPTDFSENSADAFGLACSLARDHGARLIALHVTTVPDLAYTGYGAPGAPLLKGEYLGTVRQSLAELQAGPGVKIERLLEEGDPPGEILRVAAETGADLIVIGTHGRTGLRHLLMGSVAEQVVRKAKSPVLSVRTPSA
jgi:nucleotide-binding universal stress UspA family protein